MDIYHYWDMSEKQSEQFSERKFDYYMKKSSAGEWMLLQRVLGVGSHKVSNKVRNKMRKQARCVK